MNVDATPVRIAMLLSILTHYCGFPLDPSIPPLRREAVGLFHDSELIKFTPSRILDRLCGVIFIVGCIHAVDRLHLVRVVFGSFGYWRW